jgi:hypothetical protein
MKPTLLKYAVVLTARTALSGFLTLKEISPGQLQVRFWVPLVVKYKYRDLKQTEIDKLGREALTMRPARRLRPLEQAELATLTKNRLLKYRKRALSLENSLVESDYHDQKTEDWDPAYVYFKDDPRWQHAYDLLLEFLAKANGS